MSDPSSERAVAVAEATAAPAETSASTNATTSGARVERQRSTVRLHLSPRASPMREAAAENGAAAIEAASAGGSNRPTSGRERRVGRVERERDEDAAAIPASAAPASSSASSAAPAPVSSPQADASVPPVVPEAGEEDESKESVELRFHVEHTPPPPRPPPLLDSDSEEEADGGGGGRGERGKENAGSGAATDGEAARESSANKSAPSAAEVYARPLLFYRRTGGGRSRSRRRDGSSSSGASEAGPVQLLLPDSSMALGFPPLKESASGPGANGRRGGAAAALGGGGLDGSDAVVVFTSPSEEQASKSKLWACILAFLIPADLTLVCSIYFLGGGGGGELTADSSESGSGSAANSDLVTFLCALLALLLGVIGMRLRDTRLLTLFIVVYYVDALLNLVRVASILQLSQFFMQIAVCHCMTHFKSTLVPQWWVADP